MDEFLESARRAYGNLTEPNYSFFEEIFSACPYEPLVNRLRSLVSVEDWTDPNDDVCFSYELASGSRYWHLWLSAVGPYAALARIDAESGGSSGHMRREGVVTSHSYITDPVEKKIVGAVLAAGFTILSADALERKVDFNPVNGHGPVPLFRVLFRDDEEVPWLL